MIEGNFIVIEGVDGAGTTTQAERVVHSLLERGLPAHSTCEPSNGPVGMLIRQILSGRVVVPGSTQSRSPAWTTMATLFASDRLDHLEAEVVPCLMDGVTVVCDRYDYSSVAYQTVTADAEDGVVDWVRALNRYARRPDLTLILDVQPEVAARRRNARSGGQELYEQEDLQHELCEFYRDIERHFPNDRIVHVDANGTIDQVFDRIDQEVRRLRGE